MAAFAPHRGTALLLRLRRHLLLAEPTRGLSFEAESGIQKSYYTRAAAVISDFPSAAPSQVAPSSALSVHPLCPPSPPSPSSISRHLPPPSCPTLSAPCILPLRRHSAEERYRMGMLVAVGADPAFLPVGGNAGSPKFMSASGSTRMRALHLVLGWGQRRFGSTSSERAPPVSCLSRLEKSELLNHEWVEAVEFLRKFRPLEDLRSNSLNLEIPGFADKPEFHFSSIGRPIFHRLTYLALVNSNRGYCVKDSFTIDNILICPEPLEVRFEEVKWTLLGRNSEDCDKFASYKAAGTLMQKLLVKVYEPDVIFQLCEEVTDLFGKLRWPSDERLLVYHTSFLSAFGRSWMFQWLYQVCYKVIPHSASCSSDGKEMRKLSLALQAMAYTDSRIKIEDIIKMHGLLDHIDNSPQAKLSEMSDDSSGGSRKQKHVNVLMLRGRRAIAVPRHTIVHCFDKDAKNVRSIRSTEDAPATMWPYSLDDVVSMLNTVMPLLLLKAQEAFLHNGLWHYLQMENFWPRELHEMGDVPEPTPAEAKLIGKIPYGRRRIQGRKFGHFEERPNGPWS